MAKTEERNPVRKTVTDRQQTTRYLTHSLKNNRTIGSESGLERDMTLLLEFSTGVLSYLEQPERFTITTEAGGDQ